MAAHFKTELKTEEEEERGRQEGVRERRSRHQRVGRCSEKVRQRERGGELDAARVVS